jgi:3'(2'), 5'-bisphosphate nucleotidase
MNRKELAEIAILATLEAGIAIRRIYRETEIGIEYKKDSSPITIADKKANQIINEWLRPTNIPIISEENINSAYSLRQNWEYCWIVDPLDGTKEFIKKNRQFTVNIALVERGIPVEGVVFAPELNDIYFSWEDKAWVSGKIDRNLEPRKLFELIMHQKEELPIFQEKETHVVLASISHQNTETEEYIKTIQFKHQNIQVIHIGSSLKFCMIAEGKAWLYPRFSNTMEWDTAAGHAILLKAGGMVIDAKTAMPLTYNKENLLNPWFIASK